MTALRIAIGSVTLAVGVGAQDTVAATSAVEVDMPRVQVPWGVGEIADYQVKYGVFSVGRGSMQVMGLDTDRKSTRLNSSHGYISYAVFCLKKKKLDHVAYFLSYLDIVVP